jgi:hypothetical protein
MKNVPSRAQLARYQVKREGYEAIRQTLYDYQALAATAVTQLTFFALPVGQGGKTLSDTNMTLAGQLPSGLEFLVQSIEVHFEANRTGTAANLPSAIGADAVMNRINDAFTFYSSGNLTFAVLQKDYLQEAPMGRFPPKTRMMIEGAVSNAGEVADATQRLGTANAVGRPYLLSPADVLLNSSMNFSVTLSWPEGARTYTDIARVGVVLDGILYRKSQ